MCRLPQAVRPWTERPTAPLDRDGRRSEVCTDPVPGPHAYHQRPSGEVASPGSGESAASCSAPARNLAHDAGDELHLLYKKQPGREHTTENRQDYRRHKPVKATNPIKCTRRTSLTGWARGRALSGTGDRSRRVG